MDTDSVLATIAAGRSADPLAPVTVIAPSHVAALQLRRRLAERTAFAAVRFETLPRLAELLAAGHLAAEGRSPLARPIGDYVAGQVALRSEGQLRGVRDLPGYARALRSVFARLRRGGIRRSADVSGARSPRLNEVLRLYDAFREMTAEFYDQEDLLDAAAAVARGASVVNDLGAIYVLPPGAESAGTHAMLRALAAAAPAYIEVEDTGSDAEADLLLAPDPAGEAREVVKRVISTLDGGLSLNDVAVFHGADRAYPALIREAFAAAGIPVAPVPGVPISETSTGRALLSLLRLPDEDFSRVRTMDFFTLAPLRSDIPAGTDSIRPWTAAWDKVSRKAGITRGAGRWTDGLQMLVNDRQQELIRDPENESRTRRLTYDLERARELQAVIASLVSRLAVLHQDQRAGRFIVALTEIVREYFRPDAEGFDEVLREVEQLGTVDAVRGSFNLASFREALRANLEAGAIRTTRMGEGVLLAEYRMASSLRFKHVFLCGAYEGVFPAGPGEDVILGDLIWSGLRIEHEYIEDARVRQERGKAEAHRALAAAGAGHRTISCPLYEPAATREYYPAPLMVEVARRHAPEVATAAQLRGLAGRSWLRRSPSPLGAMLRGPVADTSELTLRSAVSLRRRGVAVDQSHSSWAALEMMRGRGSTRFTRWNGNVAGIVQAGAPGASRAMYPTSLEDYATCGFRYFCKRVLRLGVVEEPEDLEMMDPAARGSLVHDVLERFYLTMKGQGRPRQYETWTEADREVLLNLLNEGLDDARVRGLTGREVYSRHESRMLRSDLLGFLDADDEFRRETGAVPTDFEVRIPDTTVAGVTLSGRADRVDRTPDGEKAWVVDYKTGSTFGFDKIARGDPLAGGRKLQLPVYRLAAADATEVETLYWFITHKNGFERIALPMTPENVDRFERTIKSIVEGIGVGAFPARSGEEDEHRGGWENCKYCDFDRICSRRRDQDYAEMSADTALRPWQQIAEVAGSTEETP